MRQEAEQRHLVTEALCRLPKMEKGEDVCNFLDCFEQSLTSAKVPAESWGRYIPDVLTGKAKEIYCASVPVESRLDYMAIKTILLDILSKPVGYYVGECFGWVKPHKATPGEVVTKVKSSLSRAYGVYGACPFPVVVLTTLSAYSQECVNSVLAKKPESAHELVKAITEFEATHGNATKAEKVDYGGRRGFSPPRQYGYGAKKWTPPTPAPVKTPEASDAACLLYLPQAGS